MKNPLSCSIHRLLVAAGLLLATVASASGQGTQDTSNSRRNREPSRTEALGPHFGQPDARSTEDPVRRRGQVFEAPGPGTWRDLDRRLARIEDELEEIRRILETLARAPGRGFDNDVDDDEEYRLQPGRQTRRTDEERFRLAPGTDGRPATDDRNDRTRTSRPRTGTGTGAPRLAPGAFGTGDGTGTDGAAGGGTGSESPSRSP